MHSVELQKLAPVELDRKSKMRVPLRWAALAVASLGQLSVVRSNMCTTSTCSSLHTPIPGKF